MRTGFGDLECSIGRASMRENRAIKATAKVNADDILLVIDQKGLTEQIQFRCRVENPGRGVICIYLVLCLSFVRVAGAA